MIKKNVEFIVPSNLSSLSDHVVVLGTKTTIRFLGILIYKKQSIPLRITNSHRGLKITRL